VLAFGQRGHNNVGMPVSPERAAILPLLDSMELKAGLPLPVELVSAAGDSSRYISHGLGNARDFTGGTPRHWFFVIPATSHRYGITSAEFGMRSGYQVDLDESRFTQELAINADLELNREKPPVNDLFRLIGGHVVDVVRKSGDLFVSGIEVTYKQVDEDEALRWSQLVYSRALLGVQDMLRKAVRQGKPLPEWTRSAISPKNRFLLAESMALSSLVAARG